MLRILNQLLTTKTKTPNLLKMKTLIRLLSTKTKALNLLKIKTLEPNVADDKNENSEPIHFDINENKSEGSPQSAPTH